MTTNVLLLHYNNYHNRIVKRLNTAGEYEDEDTAYRICNSVNFVPGDGLTTSITLGFGTNPADLFGGDEFDYLVVLNADDQNQPIVSRWFIMESTRTRDGQYELTLRRDVLADYRDDVLSSPAYVEKGWIPVSNKLIYNSESLQVSQIKKSETLLKDWTGVPWLVAYVAKNAIQQDTVVNVPSPDAEGIIAVNAPNIQNFELYQYSSASNPLNVLPYGHPNAWFGIAAYCTPYGGSYVREVRYDCASETASFDDSWRPSTGTQLNTAAYDNYNKIATDINDKVSRATLASLETDAKAYGLISGMSRSDFEMLKAKYDGQKVKMLDNTVWSVKFSSRATSETISSVNSSQHGYLYSAMVSMTDELKAARPQHIGGTPNAFSFRMGYTPDESYIVNLTQVYDEQAGATLKATHRSTLDAAYDMYCAPYGAIRTEIVDDTMQITTVFDSSEEMSMNMMNALKLKLGSSMYDLQLLPYCPIRDLMYQGSYTQDNRKISVKSNQEDKVYSMFRSSNRQLGMLFYCSSCQGEFDINEQMRVPETTADTQINSKIEDNCRLTRIVSPNFDGQFEFSVAKNGGVNWFNVDFTYKPFSPYIHVNPDFKNLYGYDSDDARGLICGGDFSLSQLSDAFTEYALQNKNFEQAFNRQIQNLDVNNSLDLAVAKVQAITGTIIGGAGGAVAGAKGGGVYGAIAGAAAGAGVSAGAGAVDVSMLRARQAENRSYAIDQFNLSIQNIKAIPYSLTKVSAFVKNNKIWPFVERYEASDDEINAFVSKLNEDGMNVSAIGTIQALALDTPKADGGLRWVKAQLIRSPSIKADAHVLAEIKEELNIGVFM